MAGRMRWGVAGADRIIASVYRCYSGSAASTHIVVVGFCRRTALFVPSIIIATRKRITYVIGNRFAINIAATQLLWESQILECQVYYIEWPLTVGVV